MVKNDIVHIKDNIMDADILEQYVRGISYEDFIQDQRTFDAVCMRIMVISESCKKLSDSVRESMETVEWHKIYGMRNILAHSYRQVDTETVWVTATEKVPALSANLSRLL